MSEPVEQQTAGPDPWKSFRGVMAGTLILEAIVVLLALPVVSYSQGGLTWISGGFLIGITGVLILLAGVQGKPWVLKANLAAQVVLIGGVVIDSSIGFIRRGVRRRVAAHRVPASRGEAAPGPWPAARSAAPA